MREIITDPIEIAEEFMRNLFGITALRKGCAPLCALISMCYQEEGHWRESFRKSVTDKFSAKESAIYSNIHLVLKRAYKYDPDRMEEIVGHSLERTASNKEFIIGAAKWLLRHQLIIECARDERFRYEYFYNRWIPIFEEEEAKSDG